MAGERPAILGISSRRSACDRCRTLKLRCPRDGPEHEPCYRCTRTEVVCTTSPIYRIRNHFRHRQTSAQTASRGRVGPVHRSTTISSPSLVLDVGPGASQVPNSDSQLWSSSLQWQFSEPSTCNGDTSQATTPIGFTFDSAESIIPLSVEGLVSPLSEQASASSIESERGGLYNIGSNLSKDELESCAAAWSGDGLGIQEQKVTEDSSTADLARVNVTLATQWNQIKSSASVLTISALVAPFAELSVNHPSGMLKSTSDFVQILKSLTRKHEPQAATQIRPKEMTSTRHSVQAQAHSPLSNPQAHEDLRGLDSTKCLVVLSSYIHLLRIYNIRFETICGLLQELADSDYPSFDLLHGASTSGGQSYIAQSGHLQATLFIQMATNLFEQVETLLGVPAEFRIDLNARNGEGLLSSDDFDSVMASVVRKEASRTTGGIHTLRHNVKRAHELLRDHIAP